MPEVWWHGYGTYLSGRWNSESGVECKRIVFVFGSSCIGIGR